MAKASVKQVVTITKGKTKSRVVKSGSGKRGNPNRCPSCGRFV